MSDHATIGARAGQRLRATADEIIAEVRGMPATLITWVPSDGVWSVMDNLCHIREFVPFWTGEVLRIAGNPTELWGRDHTDAARLAAVTSTAAFTLADVIRDIDSAVDASVSTLSRLSDSDLATEATSKNPRWGRKPASFVVEHLMVQHIEKHLGQIRRNVAQYSATTGSAPYPLP
jgi:uncharacterized damage-inducible protein DinB